MLVFIRSLDPLCLGSYWSGKPRRCSYRCIGCEDAGPKWAQFFPFWLELPRIRKSFARACCLVTNSDFMRRTIREIWGIDSVVMLPKIEMPSRVREPDPCGSILFISPVEHKGVDIALCLARQLPSEKFIFVGDAKESVRRRIATFANIEYSPWMSDMDEYMSKAKLLIMPTVIPEPYGRVCIEAMARGIPCVVSGVGALPETVGNGGDVVWCHRDCNAWLELVKRYADADYLAAKSRSAILESKRYFERVSKQDVSSLVRLAMETSMR